MLADKIKAKRHIKLLQARWRKIALRHFQYEDNGKLPKAEKLMKKIVRKIKDLNKIG